MNFLTMYASLLLSKTAFVQEPSKSVTVIAKAGPLAEIPKDFEALVRKTEGLLEEVFVEVEL